MAKVTVITPCYNDGNYLIEAVDSVTPIREKGACEHIIVDDGSTDPATLALYNQMKKRGLTILFPGKVGLGMARNIGIEHCQTPYYLNLDADNLIRPHFPELAAEVLDQNPQAGVVYGNAQFFGAVSKVSRPGPFDRVRMLRSNFIDTCSVIRKDVWQEVGGYDRHEMVWEDWNFWLSVVNTDWKFHYIDDILYDYRKRSEGSLNDESISRGPEVLRYISEKHGLTYRNAFLTEIRNQVYKQKSWNKESENLRIQIHSLQNELAESKASIATLKVQNAASEQENFELKEALEKADDKLKHLSSDLRSVLNSKTWKLTSPLRRFISLINPNHH